MPLDIWVPILALKLYTVFALNHIMLWGIYRRGLWGIRQHSRMQSIITGAGTRQEFNYFFFFLYLYALLIMPSCVSATAGSWVLTVPVLITGRRAPERWDASWHPGLILTSINTGRGSPWSDYRREWIRNRNVGKQEGREGGVGEKGRGMDLGGERRRGGAGKGEMMRGGSRRCSGEGVDDSSACLECISQQSWGLMMEVIGIHLCKGGWLWSIPPPDEVSEFPLMCIKMEYVFPHPLIDRKSVKLIGQNCRGIYWLIKQKNEGSISEARASTRERNHTVFWLVKWIDIPESLAGA